MNLILKPIQLHLFNFDEEYPGINSLKGVKAIKVVTEIKNKANGRYYKTFIKFNFKENISSKVSSFKITKRFFVNNLSSFFLFNLFLTYIFFM
jgi:hypothetical protein